MSLLNQRGEEDDEYVFSAKMDNVKNISLLLKAVNFKEIATCFGTENGLKVTVEDAKCTQANAFIQSDMFQEYNLTEDTVIFQINLSVFVECLNIFGSAHSPGSTTALKMCYKGYGHPVKVLLEEGGVITDCSIKTQEPNEIIDFGFTPSDVLNKIILRSECLKEVFSEIDGSSDMLELLMSPDPPYFRITTIGECVESQVEIPKDSEMIESFQCTTVAISRYKFSLIKPSMKSLAISTKVSIRTDERGLLCFQYMIKTEDGYTCFVEYFCSPEVDNDSDMEV
ncbi:cell cycle checkpoint protein RAD1 [Hetaerina americana]|uniref:cell cycle checkpoint protein RAD1 n=1 Tax=Hetaerina americana TaxID=62018 RepID=UPI003A7F5C6B